MGPNCPGPNLPLFWGRTVGPRAQFATFGGQTVEPRTTGPRGPICHSLEQTVGPRTTGPRGPTVRDPFVRGPTVRGPICLEPIIMAFIIFATMRILIIIMTLIVELVTCAQYLLHGIKMHSVAALKERPKTFNAV